MPLTHIHAIGSEKKNPSDTTSQPLTAWKNSSPLVFSGPIVGVEVMDWNTFQPLDQMRPTVSPGLVPEALSEY